MKTKKRKIICFREIYFEKLYYRKAVLVLRYRNLSTTININKIIRITIAKTRTRPCVLVLAACSAVLVQTCSTVPTEPTYGTLDVASVLTYRVYW